ncbi:hypothetical protein [Burkholderia sp. BCC1985]|uniref:hypothetical protein n=1 Tax=unclassified Burkholderia TaxID=2613784 RepID=UPI0039EF2928
MCRYTGAVTTAKICRSGRRFAPATENLYRAGNPLVQDIVTHWGEWRDGVPRR